MSHTTSMSQSNTLPIEGNRRVRPLHVWFILSSLAVVFTAGTSWGVKLLWDIGFRGSFTGGSLFQVNAHGHAQIFGWVGLFIMGMGTRLFPEFWKPLRPLSRKGIAASFGLMLTGIILTTVGMSAPETNWGVPMAVGGGALELLAILVYGSCMLRLEQARSTARDAGDAFILIALVWFVAQTAMSLWHTWRTMVAPNEEALIHQVSTYQAPLRDMQVHGMAVMMILGVSLKLLPRWFRLKQVSNLRNAWACGIFTTAVIMECLIFVAYRWTGIHAIAAMLMIPWIMLLVGAAMVAFPWKLWHPLETHDGEPERSTKFIRIAYGWLTVSLLLLMALPIYQIISGIEFSHAYYGAIRHAITVGFITMMILGMGARIIANLHSSPNRNLPPLWVPFVLVNLGCTLRVVLQITTDFYPWAYKIIGISGMLELAGIMLWALGIIALIYHPPVNINHDQFEVCLDECRSH